MPLQHHGSLRVICLDEADADAEYRYCRPQPTPPLPDFDISKRPFSPIKTTTTRIHTPVKPEKTATDGARITPVR